MSKPKQKRKSAQQEIEERRDFVATLRPTEKYIGGCGQPAPAHLCSGKPPLAVFEAWAVREEGLRTFHNDKEWALLEAQVYGYGGKPIRVRVEVTEI